MAKKLRNIFSEIIDFENLYIATNEAKKGKRYRRDVLEFNTNLEENLITIQNELIYKTYEVGRYREFFVYDPKKRLIMALPFKDRVVQWAIYRVLYPIYDKQFIYDSYGCRVGKGTHKAADRLQYWLRQVNRKPQKYYYLKLDISKYFYRINHKILLDILKNKIEDEDLIWLLDTIINSEDVPFGLPAGMEPDQCSEEDRLFDVGIPIGNLTSQLFANIYLNELDQYVKHKLGIHYYVRYMDDIIILADDKKYLHEIKTDIEVFLKEVLDLDLNNKTAIRPISCGIEFVGFRVWATHRKLKKKTLKKIKRKFKMLQKAYSEGSKDFEEINQSVQSYLGIMQHFDSYNFKAKLLNDTIFRRDN
ncbi:reverse transcriptase/maturase family protein [Anaerovorax sp. IOR16]|uniref:reverse transcriptase/maturase family protein n=1 Tax=Anaerovorax sp. IOR16 TaxID=2773458 RepID=UPI0019D12DED|nr:reverse transcriptase/maturase family protein [Anaerovorax sp. IOR16]